MDLEELKERYKMLPLWARFLIMGAIGLLPGAYVYYDEGDALQSQLEQEQSDEVVARGDFERSRQQKANLPKLEEDLAFTEEQLVKAKKKLPDSYKIEDVLQKAATIAKEVGVKLVLFAPQAEVRHEEGYRYVELPIKTEVQGRFSQIASFFDRIVHLETSVFVRKIVLEKLVVQKTEAEMQANQQKTDFQLARESRDKLRLKGSFEMAIFRGMKDMEMTQFPEGDAPAGDGGKKKPKGAEGDEGDIEPAAETARRDASPRDNDVTTF
jgi:Tfp pilus assembly protein PilO